MSSFSSDSVVISEYIASNQDIALFEFSTQYNSESFHLEKKYESFNHEIFDNDIIDETSFSFELGYPDLLVIKNTGIIVKIRYVSMNIWEKLTDLSTEVILYNFPKEVLSENNSFQLVRLNKSIEYNIDEIQFEYRYYSEMNRFGAVMDDNEIGIWYPIDNIPTKELIPTLDLNALQETKNVTLYNPEQYKLNRRWTYLSSYFVDNENLPKIGLEELNEISIELSNKLLEAWNTVSTPHENLGSIVYPLLEHLDSSSDFESNLVLTAPVFILMQIIAIFIYFRIIQQQSEIYNLLLNRGMSEKSLIRIMFKKYVIFNTLYLSAIAFVTYSIIRNSITSNPRILVEIKEPIIPLIIFQIIIISWNIIYHTRIFSSQRMRINVIKKKESVMIGWISVVLSIYYLLRALYLRYINNVNITQYKRNEHIISFSLSVIFFILFAFVIYTGRQKQIHLFSRKHVLKIIRKNLLIILIILSLITYNSFVNYDADDTISDLDNRLNIDRGDLTLTFRHQNSWIGYSLNLTKLSDISTINKFLPHIEFGIELIINEIATDIRITLIDDNYFANYSWTPSRSLDLDNIYIDSRIYSELNLIDEIKFVDLTGNEIISTSQLVPFDKTNSSFHGFGGIITSINTWESLGFDLMDRIYNYIDQDFEFLIKLNSRDDYDRNNFISTLSSTFEIPDSLFDIIELNNGEKRLSEEIKIKSSLNIVSLILFVSAGIILGYLLLFDKEYFNTSKLLLNKYALTKNIVQQVVVINTVIIGLSITAITSGAYYGQLSMGKDDFVESIKMGNYFFIIFQIICQIVISFGFLKSLKYNSKMY